MEKAYRKISETKMGKGKLLLERGSKPGGGREQVEEQSEVPGLDSLSMDQGFLVDSFLTGQSFLF